MGLLAELSHQPGASWANCCQQCICAWQPASLTRSTVRASLCADLALPRAGAAKAGQSNSAGRCRQQLTQQQHLVCQGDCCGRDLWVVSVAFFQLQPSVAAALSSCGRWCAPWPPPLLGLFFCPVAGSLV
jgi:hypothetical protein